MTRPEPPEDVAERLRLLLAANRTLVEKLDLPEVLRRIIAAAIDLVGARYGAIGVFDDDGRLEVFIHQGIDENTAARIGHLPRGRGLLGDLLDGGPALVLDDVTSHPHYSGFPPNHPPMRSFLGLGLEVRGRVYGNLYLTDSRDGAFSDADAALARSLAETAGVAIANARLYDESRRRESWSAASAEVTRELLASDGVDALELVAVRVQEITDASLTAVLVSGGDGTYAVVRSAGAYGDELLGACPSISGEEGTTEPTLGTVSDVSARLGLELPVAPTAPAMMVPLVDAEDPRGLLVVARDRLPRFDESDLAMARAFAGQAALALGKRELRAAREAMLVLEDRDRIARDLHDHVIQRLFASGLTLQSIHATMAEGPPRQRLEAQVAELDATIRQIRSTIFELHDKGQGRAGVRRRLGEIVGGAPGGPEVRLHVDGPVDLMLDDELADDVVAVAREAVTNARRHAQASRIDLRVVVDGTSVTVSVADDGTGIVDAPPRSGLANLEQRASARAGTYAVATGPQGTTLTWAVPVLATEGSGS